MLKKAKLVWPRLNGIICVYKPSGVSSKYVVNKIKSNLCKDLNNLETRPPEKYIEVKHTSSGISVSVRPSYADNVLCIGPRYQPEDIHVSFPIQLETNMSGVQVVSINGGKEISEVIKKCNFTKCYHITGVLGQASVDFFSDSRILARAKYSHINRNIIDRVLASYQAANQRRIFEEYGISLKSQAAYDFAVSGLFRPRSKGATVLYSLKTVKVAPPDFTIEFQCIHETEVYIKALIHNLGVSLKSYATCSQIRCLRMGCFNVEHALLKKHWTLENILDNMKLCFKVLEENFSDTIKHLPTVSTFKELSMQSEEN